MCNLNEFLIATCFDFLAGLAGRSTIENLSPILCFKYISFIETSWGLVINRKKLRLLLRYYLKVCLIKPFMSGLGINSHSMSWPAGTGPGL